MRELEQEKTTVRLDKVNQVLGLFSYEMVAALITSEVNISAENAHGTD